MLKPYSILALLAGLWLFSCNSPSSIPDNEGLQRPLRAGDWKVEMKLPDARLPFIMRAEYRNDSLQLTIFNDVEMIEIAEIVHEKDSLFISMPVFQSNLEVKIINDTTLSGLWRNFSKGPDYAIPIQGTFGSNERFSLAHSDTLPFDASGKWEVTFSPESEKPCKAIGLFKQNKNHLSGTFLTETGDYRFLEGHISDDSLFLSCFDGSHAFLFKAALSNGQLIGNFWSGNHWQEPWVAIRNDSFELTHPDSLTFLKPGFEHLSFSFPNLNNQEISLSDPVYKNKVVIVQIMGSWCPNCADETVLLSELYQKYHSKGLEIIALAYEKTESFEKAVEAVNKVKKHFNVEYEFLIAGKADKKEAQKTLPMLNHIMSYPTCIFIDRDMNIRKIRTGYYGPGAGEIHTKYIKEITEFTEMLLSKSPV